jgi:hypothetical protein
MKRALIVSAAAGILALGAGSVAIGQKSGAAAPGDCSSLTNVAIKDGVVTSAAMVKPGGAPAGRGPSATQAYCRVQVTLKPEPGSNIKIELWLPDKASWNGKFLGTGNGGSAGVISTPALVAGVNRGYAVANTDMGSSSGKGGLDFGFGIGRPDLQKDFNYRSTDGMTIEGKVITTAYYGGKPKYSYFQGCSSGGSQAWEQIQHLPDAYDGVIAGAAANNRPNLHMARIWDEWNNLKTPEAMVPKAKMAMVTQAVTAQCDMLDGVKDGIIADPRVCRPNLKPLTCQHGTDNPECLTPAQVKTVMAVWKGATNPRTKAQVYPGFEPGAEAAIDLHWDSKIGPNGQVVVSGNMINWSEQYQKAHPGGVGFDFDKDVARADADIKDANWTDPKLAAFQKAHGKVIIYHGWADGLVPTMGTPNYYEQIAKTNGGFAKTQSFARLFMVPGMGHCRGGVGPDQFDMLTALENWVEKGDAPKQIIAHRDAKPGLPALSRPLCPYPAEAKYTGKGDTSDAANFMCAAPKSPAKKS